MSLAEACVWSFVRAVVVAMACLLPARWITTAVQRADRRRRRVLAGGLVVLFLVPELLLGFVYSEATLQIVHAVSEPGETVSLATQPRDPAAARPMNAADVVAELLYAAVLLFRLTPVAALLMWLIPGPRLSDEALYCHRLLTSGDPLPARLLRQLAMIARGLWAAGLPAFSVVFLLAFQEFEIASLMQISRSPVAWTVWLFDNHAGGLMLSHSLSATVLPLVCEVAVLGLAGLALFGRRRDHSEAIQNRVTVERVEDLKPALRLSGGQRICVWLFLAWAILSIAVVPSASVSRDALVGLSAFFRKSPVWPGFLGETCTSLAFGLTSALAAFWLAGHVLRGFTGSRVSRSLALLVVLPGLIGTLVLSLAALWAFQRPGLRAAYDTPLPILVVQTLFLLPRAVLLRCVLAWTAPAAAVHISQLMSTARGRIQIQGRRLLGHYRTRPAAWVVAVLTYWGYWDLTTAAILRPVHLAPFAPGLYNSMHYGRNEILAAKTLVAVVFPLVCLLGAVFVRFLWRRIRQ